MTIKETKDPHGRTNYMCILCGGVDTTQDGFTHAVECPEGEE